MPTSIGCSLWNWVRNANFRCTNANANCMDFCRVDSVMLLDEGFKMVSSDASDKMLKEALKIRWDRRKEPAYDNWGKYLFSTTILI